MSQDYSPRCDWCDKKLNKKERFHATKKPNDKICYKCFIWFKKIYKESNLKGKFNEWEEYPWTKKKNT